MKAYEILERGLALIQRPRGWTQGAEAKYRGEHPIEDDEMYTETTNYRYCAIGAVKVAGGEMPEEPAESEEVQLALRLLNEVAEEQYQADSIAEVNDGAGKRVAQVLPSTARRNTVKCFKQAIRDAKFQEGVPLEMPEAEQAASGEEKAEAEAPAAVT